MAMYCAKGPVIIWDGGLVWPPPWPPPDPDPDYLM